MSGTDATDPRDLFESPPDPSTQGKLTMLVADHEAVDWSEVPGVSSAEAAAWTARLREARDNLAGGEGDGE